MNNHIRSFFFYIFFYSWTFFYFVTFSMVKFFSRRFTFKIANFWTLSVIKLTRSVLSIDFEVFGKENIPDYPFIIASNHQSAWETFFLPVVFKDTIFILKKDLDKIPIFRGYFKKLGFIYVDRENGYSSMKELLLKAKRRKLEGVSSIIIFPQGTRLNPGEKNTLGPGVSALYKTLSIPVVPVTHDSGKYWINKKFAKKKGKIKVKIFPPIMPGLEKDKLIKKLEEYYT